MKFFANRLFLPILLSGIALVAFVLQPRSAKHPVPGTVSPAFAEPVSRQTKTKLFIRVCLTSQPVTRILVRIDQPFKLVSIDNKKTLASFPDPVKTEISTTKTGIRLDGKVFAGSRFEIVPEKSPSIEIEGTLYRGRVRVFRTSRSRLIVVNVLPLEDYLASVLNGEMPAAFPVEARKAQVIAARSYAMYQMSRATDNSRYDLFASTVSQKYLGFRYRSKDGKLLAGETKTSRDLVHKTAGLICAMSGRLFCSYYSAVCGGETVAGKHVFKDGQPLQSVKCPWCKPARRYRWQATISFDECRRAIAKIFPNLRQRFSRVSSVTFVGQSQNPDRQTIEFRNGRYKKRISPMQFRRMFPTKIFSMRFSIKSQSERIQVTGRGHGHGVGMCQWGARGLALEGANYEKILKHYYPGTTIVSLEQLVD